MFGGFFTYARQVKSICLFSLSPAHLLRLAKACLGCAAAQLAKACHIVPILAAERHFYAVPWLPSPTAFGLDTCMMIKQPGETALILDSSTAGLCGQ